MTDLDDPTFLSGPQPLPQPERGAEPPSDREFWRSRTWWRRLGATSVGGWISTLLAFAGTIVAARALGAEGFGSVVLAVSVVALVATFLDVTLEEAVVHHGTRALVTGDVPGLRALLRRSIALDISVGAVVAGGIALLAAPLADLASAGRLDPDLVRLGALTALAVTANPTTGAVLLVANRPELRSWAAAAANLFRLVGVALAVALGGGPEAVIISYVLSSAAGSVLQAALAWRTAWGDWTAGSERGESPVSASNLLRFGLHSSVTTSLVSLQNAVLPVLLGRLSGPAAVGVFRVAMLPIFAADALSGPLRLVLFPEQARLAAKGQLRQLRRSMLAYSLIGFSVGAAGAVIGWFALPWVIPFVYSEEFDGAVLPARIMLIAAVFHFGLSWGKSFPAAIGRPGVRTALSTFMLALLVGLLLIFGDEGVKGAAIAFTSATAIASTTLMVVLFRLLAKVEQTPAGVS